ncbi:MAG: response regulator [Chloroflexales bacterium]|nr:response regulator [Chloroflexales bacterium]
MTAPVTLEHGLILIADDDESSREILCDVLGGFGYTILIAEDGRMAMQLAEYHHPDLLLLDVMMPHADGFTVCTFIRSHPVLRQLPIMMITALDDPEARLRGLQLGADDFIPKPFDPLEIQIRVRTIIDLNRYRRLWEERVARERSEAALQLRERELVALQRFIISAATANAATRASLLQEACALIGQVFALPVVARVVLGDGAGESLEGHYDTLAPAAAAIVQPIPILVGGQHVGALELHCGTRALEPGVQRFVHSIAHAVGQALERMTLANRLEQLVVQLEAMVADRTDELRAERDRTRAILEALGEAVVVTDSAGVITYVNPAAVALYEHPEALVGQPWATLQPDFGTTALVAQLTAAPERHEVLHAEAIGRRSDGRPLAVALSVAPLRDPAAPQPLTGFVSVLRDITPLKAAEHLKDQFISNVSHELRTPLSVIALHSGNLDTLYPQLGDPQRRQLIREIRAQVRALNELVTSVLELSRIEAGQGLAPAPRRECDLASLVAAEVTQQQPLLLERGLRVEVDAAAPTLVPGDRVQLRLIIRNLLSNAIKYTPEGGVIRCACTTLVAPDPLWAEEGRPPLPCARVSISDMGIGIAPKHLPFIFDRFYRADPERQVAGVGLGLSIVRELVHLHAGRVAVRSDPDQGSTFWVYLPSLTTEG